MITREIAVNVIREAGKPTKVIINAECLVEESESLAGVVDFPDKIKSAIEQINLKVKSDETISRNNKAPQNELTLLKDLLWTVDDCINEIKTCPGLNYLSDSKTFEKLHQKLDAFYGFQNNSESRIN